MGPDESLMDHNFWLWGMLATRFNLTGIEARRILVASAHC
jgi:hypothetical protein